MKSAASTESCSGCQGSGVKISIRQIDHGMVQQPCDECRGTGETISDKDRCCPGCKGEKVVQEKKILEVHVEKGMQHGQIITFPGEANQTPNTVFVVTQKDHPKFRRAGDNLFVEHTLSLTEALGGFQFALTHLDGRQLLIKTNPGEVVKPGTYKAVNDEGMPVYQRPSVKGKLYIHFTIEFPDSLTMEQCKALEGVSNEEIRIRKAQAQAAEVYDEDDDMHGGGGAERVQCAQQ
ncbi:hypothetical protein MKW94_011550 [Papaver nudicaule]|uniref:CR-type domain-containing protein n=1 Tax=Papaver nudicaule TaxID=74823 RepID=A0AA41SJK1_PAPNU|nr:hypothetical protein [Papaver nudicaule]